MRRSKWIVVVLIFLSFGAKGQAITDSVSLKQYILDYADEFGLDKEVITNPKYRFQMVYTELDSVAEVPIANTFKFGTHQYYYPASLVKFPVALLTLEKMSENEISLDDILVINNEVDCPNQRFAHLSQRKNITFRQLLEKLLIVSNNDFYSSLYHFMTPEEINERLRKKGWINTHIYKSFAGCEREHQLKCNSLTVINSDEEVIFRQESSEMDSLEMLKYYPETDDRWFGSKHENKDGDIVSGPYDLNNNLEIPLDEIHEMLVAFTYESPAYFGAWEISAKHRDFIIETMQKFPRELPGIRESKSIIPQDDEYKYAIIGDDVHGIHPTRTTSKLGLSYGFTSEIVHIKNDKDGVDFYLSVSLYTNANDIVNDGDYEYKSVAKPFIAKLSELLYQYEKSRD